MTILQLIGVIAISFILGALVGTAGYLLVRDIVQSIMDPFNPDDWGTE
jgi:hypothetical protein